jgi:hypothetical protein
VRFARAFLIAAAVLVFAFAVFAGLFIWSTKPDPGKFDRYAAERIRKLCGRRTDCQVRLRDLTSLDWDELYEWNGGYSDSDVSQVIGSKFSRTVDFGRVVALIKGGRMVYFGEGGEGIEGPIAGTVFLRCDTPSDTVAICRPDALMQVNSFNAEGDPARGLAWSGQSYVLRQIN